METKKIKISCIVSKTYETTENLTHAILDNFLADFQDCPVGCLVEDNIKKEIIN